MVKTASVSTVNVIAPLSDPKVLAILDYTVLSPSVVVRKFLLTRLKLSAEKYYSRISPMPKPGVVTQKNGIFSLTAFGKLICCDAQNLIGIAFNNYWKLSTIDSLQTSHVLPQVVYSKIANTLLNDCRIKEVFRSDTRASKVIQSLKSLLEGSISLMLQTSGPRGGC